jgi:hypothetical protein
MARRTTASAADLQEEPGALPTGDKPVPSCPPPPSCSPGDVSALLLEVLRKLNSELPSTPPLTGPVRTAVTRFQTISTELATLSDPPVNSLSA